MRAPFYKPRFDALPRNPQESSRLTPMCSDGGADMLFEPFQAGLVTGIRNSCCIRRTDRRTLCQQNVRKPPEYLLGRLGSSPSPHGLVCSEAGRVGKHCESTCRDECLTVH